jgi:hypothetical protein
MAGKKTAAKSGGPTLSIFPAIHYYDGHIDTKEMFP